ncbi:hypothetical protein TNCT_211881 [Trichonephila clavata]|uniref:Uncharacterized protein n=1 Tax=Trichonephila clavata TaxID=2740835 RepID=A0A8X6M1G8_TRICU|nr:hypothetical protein TNCT_211881 [Trichonephila clavata]
MSKEILVALNRKRGPVKAQLTRIKDFINNPDEKDTIKLESKMDTLKSLRTKLSDIQNEYYEVVANDSDLEPLELEILDLEDVIAKISRFSKIILLKIYTYDTTEVEGDDLFLQELKETSDIPLCALLKTFEPLAIISAEATLANIRNSFWIPSARNVVRKILRTASPVEKLVLKVRSN